MGVDSKLELYTTLYGWLFYNSIWEVLVATGVVFLPFIGMIVDNVLSAYTSEDVESAGNTTLRALEVDFFIAFFIILVAAVPAVPLTASVLSFTPKALINNTSPESVNPAASQSTYGGTISFVDYPNSVDLPVFWYLTLGFASGLNRAVMEDVPRQLDLREYANQLRELSIDDPVLQVEINDFFRDCYIEARSKFLDERPNNQNIRENLNRFGMDDTEWIGSRIFLSEPGYYRSLRSDSVRQGFLYSQLRDVEWDVNYPPVYGKPLCHEWWTNASLGIAQKILNQTDNIEQVAAVAEADWDAAQRRDAIIKAVLLNSPPRWSSRGYDLAYGSSAGVADNNRSIWDRLRNGSQITLAGFGLGMESVTFAAMIRIILEAAPMFQALILMGLYALLPFFIIISRYKFQVLGVGALIFFIVKFWTVLWFFAWWVDQNLIQALYPNPGDLTNLFNIDMTLKRTILNFLTGLMYLVFPVVFSTYLGFAGISAARGLNGASGGFSSGLSGAGQKASKITEVIPLGKIKAMEKSKGK